MSSLPVTESLSYPSSAAHSDGLLVALTPDLTELSGATALDLREVPGSKKAVLWFRKGARRIFYLSAVRRTGRLVIEVGGLDKKKVLRAVAICRSHFDRLFGVTTEEVKSTMKNGNGKHRRRPSRR